MSQFTNILKNGWHPEKEGTTIKTQVKGLVGRGDNTKDCSRNRDHVSRPLHSLADPSTLPPPPQRRDTSTAATTGTATPPPPPAPAAKRRVVAAPSTRPLGQRTPSGEETAPRPYRSDTTGLRTDHLPPPPGRRDGADGRSPPPPPPPPPTTTTTTTTTTSYNSSSSTTTTKTQPPAPPTRGAGGGTTRAPPPPPSLPPRLPPRDAASPSPRTTTGTTSSASSSGGLVNAGAVNRLGARGISVPALGIGSSGSADRQESDSVDRVQNRFARFNATASSATSQEQRGEKQPAAATQGTTWAQKQAALRTASQLQKDPSSVSLADAKTAASTANNFRQRHGEQVAAAAAAASRWNTKYGVADKVGGLAQRFQGGQAGSGSGPGSGPDQNENYTARKKPPPPPPPPSKKKPELQRDEQDAPPPPIPMSTRPNF